MSPSRLLFRSTCDIRPGDRACVARATGRLFAIALAGLTCSVPTQVFAVGNIEVAQQLFEEGRKAKEAGDTKTACDFFRRSNDEVESVGALQQLGECNDKLGNFATSWSSYKKCESVGAVKKDSRAADCASAAATVEPKRAKITLNASKPPPGMVVKADGKDVTASLGIGLPLDAGVRKIEISAPGFVTKTIDVTVPSAPGNTPVDIPELEPDSSSSGTGGTGTGTGSGSGSGSGAGGGTSGGSKGMSGVMIGGLVVGGVGAAGLIVGAAMGGAAIGAKSDVDTLCPNQTCSTQEGKDALSTAKTDATVSTIGFIAGGVLLAGGAVMVIVGAVSGGKKSDEKAAASLYLVPSLSPTLFGDTRDHGFNGAVFGGSF